MGVIATAARELIAAGITGEALIEALERIEDAQPRGDDQPTKRQARNRRYYENKRLKPSETRLNKTIKTLSDGDDLPDKERVSHTLPKEINPSPSLRSGTHPARARETPLAELSKVLDEQHARGVVDHRQRTGKPLTPYAASLLAKKFAACHDPNAAADAMVANGWQGFEPEWLEGRQHRSTGPPGKPRAVNGFAAAFLDIAAEHHEQPDHDIPGRSAKAGPRADPPDQQPDLLDAERPVGTSGPFSVADRR